MKPPLQVLRRKRSVRLLQKKLRRAGNRIANRCLASDDGCSVSLKLTRDKGARQSTLRCRAKGSPGRELCKCLGLCAGLSACRLIVRPMRKS